MKYYIYCRKSQEDDDRQVQSIPDQERIMKDIAEQKNLEIVEVLKESKSGSTPGRPLFKYMLQQIEAGKAQGILTWKLDRLARNPVDGGNVSWMLQQGTIQKIITADRDYNPEDNVLMLNVEFGMANQFILDLRKNTKRGMRSKCEKGWFPGVAPLGYLNNKYCDKGEKSIIKDEERYYLVRKMWDLMLTNAYSINEISEIAKKWGFATPQRKKSGGRQLSANTLNYIFNNPFYYGEFEWGGEIYPGKHEKMVTRGEFEAVQKILGNKGRPRGSLNEFAYTGLIRCSECGCMVTAEHKTKKLRTTGTIKEYTYYHCTHKRKGVKCSQKAIEEKELEKQIKFFLENFTIDNEYIDWIIKFLHEYNEKEVFDREEVEKSIKAKLSDCIKRLDNLIRLKIAGDLLTDEEFKSQKNDLMEEKKMLLDELDNVSNRQDNWVNSTEKAINFLRGVVVRFNEGTLKDKKIILSTLGSHLTLKDKKLSIQANGVYRPLEKGIIETKYITQRFAPAKGQLITNKKAFYKALSIEWLPRSGSN